MLGLYTVASILYNRFCMSRKPFFKYLNSTRSARGYSYKTLCHVNEKKEHVPVPVLIVVQLPRDDVCAVFLPRCK